MNAKSHWLTAIHPPGCRCSSCAVGTTIALNSPRLQPTLEAVLRGEIEIPENLTRDTTIIIYSRHGQAFYELAPIITDYLTVLPTAVALRKDTMTVSMLDDLPQEARHRLITNFLNRKDSPSNPTNSTFVLYRTPGNLTGSIELYNCQDEPLILFPEG